MAAKRVGGVFFVVLLLPCWSTFLAAGEVSVLPTAAQRLEFFRNYHSWSPRERRDSLKLLLQPEYRNNATVGAALHDIALYDKDPESRLTAFEALCRWDDPDGRLAYHLSRLFKLELEPSIKPRMAQAMTRLKFKTDVLNVMIGYTFSPGVDYPYYDRYDGRYAEGPNRTNGLTTRRGGGDWWLNANFRILLDSINKISGQRFVPSYDSARQVIKWWHLNSVDFQADDMRLAQQYRNGGKNTPTVMAVAEPADPRTSQRVLLDVLDREEQVEEAPKIRGQELLKKLEPSASPERDHKAVDENEIE